MFIATLFTIVRTWKQPQCPSTDEWMKKLWYIYTMEYYSVMKRNKIGSFVVMWMNLESVIQSEVSQKKENIIYYCTYVESTKMVQFSPVTQSCLTLCYPIACSTPGFQSITNSQSLHELMSIESVMPSNHLILCHSLLLPPSNFPSFRVFSNESVLPIR